MLTVLVALDSGQSQSGQKLRSMTCLMVRNLRLELHITNAALTCLLFLVINLVDLVRLQLGSLGGRCGATGIEPLLADGVMLSDKLP